VRIRAGCKACFISPLLITSGIGKSWDIELKVGQCCQAYLVQSEGKSDINGIVLNAKAAIEGVEELLCIKALETTHVPIM